MAETKWFNWNRDLDKEEVIIEVIKDIDQAPSVRWHYIEGNIVNGKPKPFVRCGLYKRQDGTWNKCDYDHEIVGNSTTKFYWEVKINNENQMFTFPWGAWKQVESRRKDIVEGMNQSFVGSKLRIIRRKVGDRVTYEVGIAKVSNKTMAEQDPEPTEETPQTPQTDLNTKMAMKYIIDRIKQAYEESGTEDVNESNNNIIIKHFKEQDPEFAEKLKLVNVDDIHKELLE